jgi:hypothetical protein
LYGPDQTVLDLILGVHLRSSGTGQKTRKGGRRCDAGGNTRGGASRNSPELGVPAAPGVKSTRAWVGRDPRDTRELPRAKARHGRGSSDEHDGGGGSARWRNDGARVPGARKDPGLRHLAHKLRGFDAMLTRGLRRPKLRRKEDDDDDRRRRGSGSRGGR